MDIYVFRELFWKKVPGDIESALYSGLNQPPCPTSNDVFVNLPLELGEEWVKESHRNHGCYFFLQLFMHNVNFDK